MIQHVQGCEEVELEESSEEDQEYFQVRKIWKAELEQVTPPSPQPNFSTSNLPPSNIELQVLIPTDALVFDDTFDPNDISEENEDQQIEKIDDVFDNASSEDHFNDEDFENAFNEQPPGQQQQQIQMQHKPVPSYQDIITPFSSLAEYEITSWIMDTEIHQKSTDNLLHILQSNKYHQKH